MLTSAALTGLTTTGYSETYYPAWLQEYDRASGDSQGATAVGMDAAGNVFVTGYAKEFPDEDRYYTAKYAATDGRLLWSRFYNPAGYATPYALVVDGEGNVIVTGGAVISGDEDIYTVKYNGVTGDPIWAKPYDANGGLDQGVKVTVDPANNVLVLGLSYGSATGGDICAIKYTKDAGDYVWATPVHRFSGNGTRLDRPGGIAVDGSSNTIIVGSIQRDDGKDGFAIRSLNSLGVTQWTVISGGEYSYAKGVAVDGAGNAYATGYYTNASGWHGIYTVAYNSAGSSLLWNKLITPAADDYTGMATSIAVGPDGNPVITGWREDAGGNEYGFAIKYRGTGLFAGNIMGEQENFGLGFGDTRAQQVITDGSSNTIIVGESENEAGNQDLFVVKYGPNLAERLFAASFGGDWAGDDKIGGVAVGDDGSIAIAGEAWRTYTSTGRTEIATIKFNRLRVASGDLLPDDPDVPKDAVFSAGTAPAVSDNGTLLAKVTIASGKKKLGAILRQSEAGTTSIPAVQNGAVPGLAEAEFSKFSDPIVAPNGRYAFAAKVTGVPGSQANGVWTDLSGTLTKVLQQGTQVPVAGLTDINVKTVMSLSLRDSQLVALLKVTGPANENTLLLGLNTAGQGTVLLRTNQTVTVDGTESTIKTITTLSPTKLSPGDGRWQGNANTLARVTLADKRTVLFRITTAGVPTPLLSSGQDAALPDSQWKAFGLPAIGSAGSHYAVLGTMSSKPGIKPAPVTGANDLALIYSSNGSSYTAFATENGPTNDPDLAGLSYATFSDPW